MIAISQYDLIHIGSEIETLVGTLPLPVQFNCQKRCIIYGNSIFDRGGNQIKFLFFPAQHSSKQF